MLLTIENVYPYVIKNVRFNPLYLIYINIILINEYIQESHYYPFAIKLDRTRGGELGISPQNFLTFSFNPFATMV